jgi:hypothetical protein
MPSPGKTRIRMHSPLSNPGGFATPID